MSEITGTAKVHEAYAFACMRCGHGWEQSYEIEHHVDATGQEFVVYRSGGERVPSPLSSPNCLNCGGHVVRIMRSGQVSSVLDLMEQTARPPVSPSGPIPAEGERAEEAQDPAAQAAPGEAHHWHLSDLLRPFHHRK
jgi:hypothetical protein